METATAERESLLPKEKTKPAFNIETQSILLYGPPKIGKTTFASQAPGVLFLATEKGLGFLEAHSVTIKSWEHFIEVMGEVAQGEHAFKTIAIDTIDNLVKLLALKLCEKHKVGHVSFDRLGFGVGADMMAGEIARVLLKITNELELGLILISHATTKNFKVSGSDDKETKIIPTLPDKVREVVVGHCDHILYAEIREGGVSGGKLQKRHVMRTTASREYDAGSRLDGLPDPLPLKWSAFEEAIKGAQAKKGN